MPPPFDINSTSPASNALISAFPADEQANRAEIEEWLSYISDPATGMIRASVSQPPFPAGTLMLFVQTAAPTGWTKDTNHDNKALRIVTGAASNGGTVDFTAAFTSQAVTGTTNSTAGGGTVGNTTAGGTVGSHALTVAEMPAHTHHFTDVSTAGGGHSHDYQRPATNVVVGTSGSAESVKDSSIDNFNTSTVPDHTHTVDGDTTSAGSSTGHSHSFSGISHTHTFTGSGHTHTFTGTAINLAVKYVDVIIASKDA
jgi:hypothetical protein